ncbi:PP2C family protein-serine/threonine phosphatase [Allokutzneria albata]|uniref:Serine/threonine protein phosphatase PrpC n=1 Tax=Allokutzneria albata TaxID=211114 RepID=A0A1G9TBE2_ALLAB|nr:PP2C family serine/threonine-protein phosphatase [Allokutzneria albata]SDM44991.1 Serine/threonine protein phosphatase PrpC [Allokutzneria albata]
MITAAAGSETGKRYRANFDVVHLTESPLRAVVADGMGDGEGSGRAGRTAVDTFVAGVTGDATADSLRAAVSTAQHAVAKIPGFAGCTLTAMVESSTGFWITQIGDSRAYRLRRGLLELLTVDHTMAWLGAVNGWYPFDSREAAAARYHLTRYIGHPELPEPDVLSVTVRPGDIYLLCSDGIAEQVPFQRIRDVLGQPLSPQAKVGRLLADAEAAGGNDNATAVVVATP